MTQPIRLLTLACLSCLLMPSLIFAAPNMGMADNQDESSEPSELSANESDGNEVDPAELQQVAAGAAVADGSSNNQKVSIDSNGVTANVLGHSGKITFGFANNTKRSMITFSALREVNSAGKIVGNTGSTKHSLNSFASTDFTFSSVYAAAVDGVPAVGVNFSVSVLTGSNLKISLFAVAGSGDIQNGNETFPLRPGNLKFNVEMTNWPFCTAGGSGLNDCKGETGTAIELDIEVKTLNETPSGGNDTVVTLGDNAVMRLASEILVDGAWMDMDTGYPNVTRVENKTIVTIRFPQFAASAFYDPIISMGQPSTPPVVVGTRSRTPTRTPSRSKSSTRSKSSSRSRSTSRTSSRAPRPASPSASPRRANS